MMKAMFLRRLEFHQIVVIVCSLFGARFAGAQGHGGTKAASVPLAAAKPKNAVPCDKLAQDYIKDPAKSALAPGSRLSPVALCNKGETLTDLSAAETLGYPDEILSFEASKNGKFIATTLRDGRIFLEDLDRHNRIQLSYPEKPNKGDSVRFTNDGKLRVVLANGVLVERDLKTNQETRKSAFPSMEMDRNRYTRSSEDGRYFSVSTNDYGDKVKIYDAQNGGYKTLDKIVGHNRNWSTFVRQVPDALQFDSPDGQTVVKLPAPAGFTAPEANFSPNEKKATVAFRVGGVTKRWVVDLTTGKAQETPGAQGLLQDDGTFLLASSANSDGDATSLLSYDPSTKLSRDIALLPVRYGNLYTEATGSIGMTDEGSARAGSSQRMIHRIGRQGEILQSFRRESTAHNVVPFGRGQAVVRGAPGNPYKALQVVTPQYMCSRGKRAKTELLGCDLTPALLEAALGEKLKFNWKDFSKLCSDSANDQMKRIDDRLKARGPGDPVAKLWLSYRLPALADDMSIYQERERLLDDEGLWSAPGRLLTLLASTQANPYYKVYLAPAVDKVSMDGVRPDETCLNPKRKEQLVKLSGTTFSNFFMENLGTNRESNPALVAKTNKYPLRGFVTLRAPDDLQKFLDDTARDHTGRVMDYVNQGAFRSSVHYLTRAALERALGLSSYQPRTDISLRVGVADGAISPQVFSNEPITGGPLVGTEISYGNPYFHVYTAPTVSLARDQLQTADPGEVIYGRELHWGTAGADYKSEIRAIRKDSKSSFTPTKGPRMDEMWKDKKLVGALIFGSGIEGGSPNPVDEYIEYLEENDFELEGAETSVDTLDFLGRGVSSGQIDYLIKEAHSDGDTRNVVVLTTKSKMKTFVKKLPDGREERFYMLRRDHASSSASFPNQTLGEWMKSRAEKPGTGEMVYLNMSCSSAQKGANEFSAVGRSNFTVIPSASSAKCFNNADDWPAYHLVNGVREGHTWAKIRDNMDAARAPRANLSYYDKYLFPDQPEYRAQIVDSRSSLVDMKTEVFRKDKSGAWKKVNNINDGVQH